MSKIKEIIEHREVTVDHDQGRPPTDYSMHIDNLKALDVLVDKLTRAAREIARLGVGR